jgi:pimeloyl-ACP methyl ester carboxylesterase
MGGLLGPADGLYHDLGVRFAEQGIGLVRVGYRKPNDLAACVHDLVAVAELAARRGGRRFVTMGHSFGGAVAIRAGIVLGDDAAGVVTLATQSAGCEDADRLAGKPVLLLHGTNDEILPPQASELVQMLTGGELVTFPGSGHLFTDVGDELRERLGTWIPARFG